MTSKPHSAWTRDEWLYYLEHAHKPEVQLRLVNSQRVAARMDLLAWDIPVITVGGTNGKGSTVAALSAIYQAAGYRVGQFTSPHLLTFNERISVNAERITDEALCLAFTTVDALRQDTPLTYFEMSFLAALYHFKQSALDVLLLEVGVGGRLDATNIIDADLAIITTVDLDHQAYLGQDKEAIGLEKAGILRANRPFIYADYDPPQTVIGQAQTLQTDMACLGFSYTHHIVDNNWHIVRDGQEPIILPIPEIHPNAAAAAVLASERLQARLPVSHEAWQHAMRQVRIMGRLQWVPGPVTYLYDVAHNPQAARLLAHKIIASKPGRQVHAIFSALQDKDICGLIRPLSSIVDHWYPSCLTGKRAATRADLQSAFAATLGVPHACYDAPSAAYQAVVAAAQPGDLVIVYGSFVLVAAVMVSVYQGADPPFDC